jgi:hypothetical protein
MTVRLASDHPAFERSDPARVPTAIRLKLCFEQLNAPTVNRRFR